MIRINLLPYRAQRRQTQILQHLAVALGSIVLVLLLLGAVHAWKATELSSLEDEYRQLKQQNDALKKKIGELANLDQLRADVQGKLNAVDKLQKGRFHTLNTLHELSKVIPANVWITSISDSNGQLSLSGLGESNKAVANFLRALDESPLFGAVQLQVISRQQIGSISVRLFSLSITRLEPEEGGKS